MKRDPPPLERRAGPAFGRSRFRARRSRRSIRRRARRIRGASAHARRAARHAGARRARARGRRGRLARRSDPELLGRARRRRGRDQPLHLQAARARRSRRRDACVHDRDDRARRLSAEAARRGVGERDARSDRARQRARARHRSRRLLALVASSRPAAWLAWRHRACAGAPFPPSAVDRRAAVQESQRRCRCRRTSPPASRTKS